MFVGVGASRVRDLFDQAKRNAPCIIFIDEIDAVGRQRGAGLGGSHDEREQTLNQILVEMDGFDTNTNVIVIAATNRPDVLDPALVRPGRFDRQVILDAPDVRGRLDILKVHTKGKPLSEDVNLEAIARLTPGSSGADLANIVNEAAILAARRGKKRIGGTELQDATERMMMGGPERRSRVYDAQDEGTGRLSRGRTRDRRSCDAQGQHHAQGDDRSTWSGGRLHAGPCLTKIRWARPSASSRRTWSLRWVDVPPKNWCWAISPPARAAIFSRSRASHVRWSRATA